MAALSVGEAGEDLGQEFHELRTALNDHVNHCMTNSVVFDPQEELLWAGTESVSKGFITLMRVVACLLGVRPRRKPIRSGYGMTMG